MVALGLLLDGGAAFAQGGGNSGLRGIEEATRMMKGYFDPFTKLVYAVAAIIGIMGAVRVYQKMSNGDPDVGKTAMMWFGASVFMVIAVVVIRAFFEL